MDTQLLSVDPLHPEAANIDYAAELLRAGQLVAFPTETVYGLGADARCEQAVAGIFAAKGRPFSDPLIVHIADISALETLASDILPLAYDLAASFWPGPLTLILPAKANVPKLVTAGLPTVAIRMPQHPVARALIQASGLPIAAPSANRFMHVSPTTAQHVLADLNGRIPLILDGGPCQVGLESTILDLSSYPPTILRPGGLSLEALQSALPEIQLTVTTAEELQLPQMAPGQMLTHYSPTIPTFLFEGKIEVVRSALLAEIKKKQSQGEKVGVLLADEDRTYFQESGAQIYTLGETLEEIATRLFTGLRTLEGAGVDCILCRSFPAQGLGLAIHDRLSKAAGGKIIAVEVTSPPTSQKQEV